ncbi:VARLMGL domain-containing protein [Abeliophyllum distichum]|uniref:VARLMGL domain-containing protein n=1 Tax=Abeliophyllum distichum TaxID=126358 RepID=A0ABD1RDS3_9LAMI
MRPSSFFSSSSSSSTTTTTTTTASPSFDGKTYNNNSKNGSQGCLTGVLRRLLCLSSLPAYPRDHFKEEEKQPLVSVRLQCVEEANSLDAFTSPGVVARLMGLESRPHITEESPNSIGRSQSMNSIHSSTTLKSIQERHRHVKSFREIPSYLELEDESFFIMSFEKAGEIWQGMKSDMNSGEKKPKKKAICKNNFREIVPEQNKENQDANKVSKCQKHPSNVLKNSCQKPYVVFELVDSDHKGRGRTRRKKTKSEVTKLETDCDPKDLSPNSILDFAEFPPEPDPDAPDSGQVSRLANSKFRRTLSEELENYRKSEKRRLIRNDYDPKRSKEKWIEVCQLVERETSQSNWIFKEILKADDFQEIERYLALQILDQMLAELLNNLLEIPMKYFDPPP